MIVKNSLSNILVQCGIQHSVCIHNLLIYMVVIGESKSCGTSIYQKNKKKVMWDKLLPIPTIAAKNEDVGLSWSCVKGVLQF